MRRGPRPAQRGRQTLATTAADHDTGATVIVAVVPAYNEAPAIASVVGEALNLEAQGRKTFARVIVVDNDSSDGTGDIAARAGAQVVRETRRGYGAACLAGIAAAADADVIVFVDGDASVDLAQTATLLAPLSTGADLVIGARFEVPAGAMGVPQRFGNRLAAILIRLLWRHPTTDLGPFRAIRVTSLARLGMRDVAFGWTVEMQVRAIQQGLRTVEVPVRVRPRIGVSKISGTVRGVMGAGTGILGTITRLWLSGRRAGAPAGMPASPPPAHPPPLDDATMPRRPSTLDQGLTMTTPLTAALLPAVQAFALAASLALGAPAAWASGGNGPLGVPGDLSKPPRRPANLDTELYNEGKLVAKEKLMCRACPLAKQTLDTELATRLMQDPALTENLDSFERGVLEIYLRRRFEL